MIKRERRRHKKGEVMAQPFMFILVLIIIVFTLVFGFKMVKNLMGTQEKVKYADFRSDFSDAVNEVYNANAGTTIIYARESNNYKPMLLPKEVDKVCIDGNKVSFGMKEGSGKSYSKFEVDNLKGNNICIKAVSGYVSFTLKNVVQGKEVFALITENEK